MRYSLKIALLVLSLSPIFAYPDELNIRGDELKIFEKENRYILKGNVRVERGDLIIFADSVELIDNEQSSRINGDFYLLTSSFIFSGAKVEILKKTGIKKYYNLSGGVLKLSINPSDYIDYDSKRLLSSLQFRMRLKTAYLKQVEDNKYYARDVRYTLCNCKENNTWELSAESLYYEKDCFLLSLSNIFYLHDIPVLYLPLIILPVGERRSGFLFPETGFNSTAGFILKNAYYQTLGPSADATFYLTLMSEKGQMYSLEFRYRPYENLYGRSMVSFVNNSSDRSFDRRFNIKNEHRFEYKSSFVFGVDSELVSDSSYMSDLQFDFWDKNIEYRTNRVYAGYLQDYFLLDFEMDYYQNFKQGLKRERYNFFSEAGLAESQRLPSVSITILPLSLILNTDIMVGLDYTNYYSLSYDYKKIDLYGNPLLIDNDKRDLLSFQRFSLSLPLHNYFEIADIIEVNQYLKTRASLYQLPSTSYYLNESSYEIDIRTDLYRKYDHFIHLITPALQYKNLFYLKYTKDGKTYTGKRAFKDEKDNFIKSQYLLLNLNNSIYDNRVSRKNRVLSLSISMGFQEIIRKDITPLILSPEVSLSYLKLSGDLFCYLTEPKPYIDSIINLIASDKRGDSLTIKYHRIKNYLENPFVTFNEDFKYYLLPYYEKGFDDIYANMNISLTKEISLGYFITYLFKEDRLLFHGGGIYYHSKCNCLNAGLTFVMYNWYEVPSFMTSLNLGTNM